MSKYRVSIKSATTNRRSFLQFFEHWWKCIIHVSQTRSSISQTNFLSSLLHKISPLSNVFVNRFKGNPNVRLSFSKLKLRRGKSLPKRSSPFLEGQKASSLTFHAALDSIHTIRGAFNSLTSRDQPATVQEYPPLRHHPLITRVISRNSRSKLADHVYTFSDEEKP